MLLPPRKPTAIRVLFSLPLLLHRRLLLAIAVVLGCLAPAGAQVDWEWRAPVAAGHDLSSVAYGSGKFVAVGQGWMTSANGETWEDQGMFPEDGKNPTFVGMADVAYGNGYFVAVGSQGRIFRSLHGNGWTALTLPTPFLSTEFGSVAFGKGIWVITTRNEIYVSTNNCESIAKVTLPAASGLSFSSVSYGAGPTGSGQFVAGGSVQKTVAGSGPYSYGVFFSSNDGVNWTSFEEGTPVHSSVADVVWDGLFNQWLAILPRGFNLTAEYWSSDNGVLWTSEATTTQGSNHPIALSYGEGRVAAVSREQGFQSTSQHADGWAFVQGPAVGSSGQVPFAGEYFFRNLTYSEDLGRWVAVGLGGQIAWSDAPLLWHLGVANERRALDVGRALGDFYAVDPLKISRSSDGITWQTVFDANFVATLQVPNPPAPGEPLITYGPYSPLFRGLGTSPNELVAVGKQGRIFTSTTGSTWASQDNWFEVNDAMARVRSTDLNHAARGPLGGWVVVGTGGFIGSTAADGSGVWVVRESNTTDSLNRVVHSGTNFVAVGASGRIVVSDNGSSWTDRSPAGTTQTFTTVAVSGSVSNPVLVASGASALFTSHDHGQTWVQRPLPLTSATVQQATAVTAVCWAGSEFVGTGLRGVVLVSPDGINWAVRKKGATFGSRSQAIAFDGSTYVLAADGLLSSPSRVVAPLHLLNVTAANGTVTRFPDLPSYETGTLVKLTAQPAPGYQFSSWSGFPLEFFPTMVRGDDGLADDHGELHPDPAQLFLHRQTRLERVAEHFRELAVVGPTGGGTVRGPAGGRSKRPAVPVFQHQSPQHLPVRHRHTEVPMESLDQPGGRRTGLPARRRAADLDHR